jgi:hypothetical protein
MIALVLWFASSATLFAADNYSISPTTKGGNKWCIGYYEGGEYIDYQKIFTETIMTLWDVTLWDVHWIIGIKIPTDLIP